MKSRTARAIAPVILGTIPTCAAAQFADTDYYRQVSVFEGPTEVSQDPGFFSGLVFGTMKCPGSASQSSTAGVSSNRLTLEGDMSADECGTSVARVAFRPTARIEIEITGSNTSSGAAFLAVQRLTDDDNWQLVWEQYLSGTSFASDTFCLPPLSPGESQYRFISNVVLTPVNASFHFRATAIPESPWDQNDAPWADDLYGASHDNGQGVDPVRTFIATLRATASIHSANEDIDEAILKQYFADRFLDNQTWFPDSNGNNLRFDAEDLTAVADTLEARRSNYNIAAVGCAITSLAIAAEAVSDQNMTPGQLYAQLRQSEGGSGLKGISTPIGKLFKYSGAQNTPRFTGLNLLWDSAEQALGIKLDRQTGVTPENMKEALDDCKVVVVFDKSHWSVVDTYRERNGILEFREQDPFYSHGWYGVTSTQWQNWVKGGKRYEVSATGGTRRGSIATVTALAPDADAMLITDPNGNRLGRDPETGETYNELLDASYERSIGPGTPDDVLSDDEWEQLQQASPRSISLRSAAEGQYQFALDSNESIIYLEWATANNGTFRRALQPNATSYGGVATTTLTRCPADVNNDTILNTSDVVHFINLWIDADSAADWNADLGIDSNDFIGFLNDWTAGC